MERPEYFQTGFCSQFVTENRQSSPDNNVGADHFIVEDLLDFSNDDDNIFTDAAFDNQTGSSTDSSTLTVLDSGNSSSDPAFGHHCFSDVNFSTDLCLPYDDLAELEWVSSFVEESFSTEDLEKLSLISGMNSRADGASKPGEFRPELNRNNHPVFHPEMSVPAKARSKRSRAAPCIWNSGLSVPVISPATSSSETDVYVTSHPSTGTKTVKPPTKKKENSDDPSSGNNGEGRKCLHCATDKTPQWRTGPMGPKTLCNACGVRYKSGRLVPEYRPAASPTFVLTKHSNSHRKVVELRRQKEFLKAQQQYIRHENSVFDVSNNDDYLIHQQMGPDFG